MSSDRIVITGGGIVSPIGVGLDSFWEALLARKSGIRSLAERTDEGAKPLADSRPLGLWIGGAVIDFDAKLYVRPRKSLKVMCREIQTAFAASQMSLDQAGLSDSLPASVGGPIAPDRVGTVFGSEMFYGPPDDMISAIQGALTANGDGDLAKFGELAMREIMPLWMLKYLPNMPACHFGIAVNALGPNNTLVLGEVSGPAALIEAVSCIERNLVDVVFCGASGTRINTTRMNYRGDLPIPDVDSDAGDHSIAHASRPHDLASSGVVAGEGAASLAIESIASAASRKQDVLAVISGYAARFIPSPRMLNGSQTAARGSSDAIEQSILGALRKAELAAGDIALVVSQGIGDTSMDLAERQAISRTLGDVPIVAPVAAIGHTGAAIGTIGLVTGLLSLMHRTAPPTLNAEQATDSIRLLCKPQPLAGNHVICLSHTSEGNAVAVILSS